MRTRVKKAWDNSWHPNSFTGSWKDYARSYAIITTIAEKRTISRLKDVYKYASDNRVPLLNAIEKEVKWNRKSLYKNINHQFGIN